MKFKLNKDLGYRFTGLQVYAQPVTNETTNQIK